MARRYKSLHHNLEEGENKVFHREHRSKGGQRYKQPHSLQELRYRMKKQHGNDAKYFRMRD